MRMQTLLMVFWMICFSTSSGNAQGKGYYRFNNISPSDGLNAPIFNSEGALLTGPYQTILYAGTSRDSLAPTLMAASINEIALGGLIAPGYFTGGIVRADNVPGRSLSFVQVRMWDSALGATYEEVAARNIGGYGESSVFPLVAGYSESILQPVPLVGLESFSIRPVVPEPEPVTLLGLGPVVFIASRMRE